MPLVLLTGFEPFDGHPLNPSQLLVRSLHGRVVGQCRLGGLELPCEFERAWPLLEETLVAQSPIAVVCLGLAQEREAITPERIAINCIDAWIPDNSGRQPVDEPVLEGGPAAYFSTLPIKSMVEAIRGAGLPAKVSDTAGTYVCNALFYRLMHFVHGRSGDLNAGFVHIPPSQELRPGGLPLERLEAGVLAALEAVVRGLPDAGNRVEEGEGAGYE